MAPLRGDATHRSGTGWGVKELVGVPPPALVKPMLERSAEVTTHDNITGPPTERDQPSRERECALRRIAFDLEGPIMDARATLAFLKEVLEPARAFGLEKHIQSGLLKTVTEVLRDTERAHQVWQQLFGLTVLHGPEGEKASTYGRAFVAPPSRA